MQVLQGYVNAVRQVTTRFGEKIVLDVVAGHREAQVWRPGKDTHLLSISSGSPAQFTCDSKGKYHLVDDSVKAETGAVAVAVAEKNEVTETVTEPAKKHVSTISDDTKREIARYVKDMADLYGFCLKSAGEIGGISDNDRRQIATTLFISTRERFNI